MVPKSGSRLPNATSPLSDARVAALIGSALQDELGASRRATKTVIRWTGVSDRTARAWLNGSSAPSSSHLIVLAANCGRVMTAFLKLAGHESTAITVNLEAVELGIAELLETVQRLRREGG